MQYRAGLCWLKQYSFLNLYHNNIHVYSLVTSGSRDDLDGSFKASRDHFLTHIQTMQGTTWKHVVQIFKLCVLSNEKIWFLSLRLSCFYILISFLFTLG